MGGGEPPAAAEEDDDMADGAIGWFELNVPDIARATKFYGAILPWKLQAMEGYDGYVIVNVGENGIGALQASEAADPAGRATTLYFEVTDLEDTLERVKAEGGTVLQDRMEVPGPMWIGQVN